MMPEIKETPVKSIVLLTLLFAFNLHAETNQGVFSEIQAGCEYGNGNAVDCKIKVTVNSLTHPDYFEEVTHLVIVENKDCSKAVYNDILYLSKVDFEGQTFEVVKTYPGDIKTWFSACLFMEEELVESLPIFAEGYSD